MTRTMPPSLSPVGRREQGTPEPLQVVPDEPAAYFGGSRRLRDAASVLERIEQKRSFAHQGERALEVAFI
jgi:hypothetical protein